MILQLDLDPQTWRERLRNVVIAHRITGLPRLTEIKANMLRLTPEQWAETLARCGVDAAGQVASEPSIPTELPRWEMNAAQAVLRWLKASPEKRAPFEALAQSFVAATAEDWSAVLAELKIDEAAVTARETRQPTRKQKPPAPPPLGDGPGTEMLAITQALGIVASKSCGCKRLARKMNEWGVDGCKEHRAEIVAETTANLENWKWTPLLQSTRLGKFAAMVKATWLAATTGLATKINPADVIGSLVDEAIRRADTSPDT